MTVQLSPEIRKFIDEQLLSGRYPDTEAVLRDAISALGDRLTIERKRAELRREIALGDADIEAGRYKTLTPELLESIRQRAMKNLGVAE